MVTIDMREWKIKLDEYGIDKDLYAELKAFCRQYGAKQARLNAIRGGFNCLQQDGMPKCSMTGDPTGRRAELALQLEQDIAAVNAALKKACEPGMQTYVLNSIAYGMRFEEMPIPSCRDTFFKARRMFFYHLAVELGKIA